MDVASFTADITRRSRWARDHNGGHPAPAWSTGERLAVALVLDDKATFDAEGYTKQEAAQRINGDLLYYGYTAGAGTWLQEVRAALSAGGKEDSRGTDGRVLAEEIRCALAAWKEHQARMATAVLARSPGDEIADELGELLERVLPLAEGAQL
jgi:hypothetical protein